MNIAVRCLWNQMKNTFSKLFEKQKKLSNKTNYLNEWNLK